MPLFLDVVRCFTALTLKTEAHRPRMSDGKAEGVAFLLGQSSEVSSKG